jgi:hypothetical protein
MTMKTGISFACILLCFSLMAQDKPDSTQDFTVDGGKQWLDTGLELKAGDVVRLTGSGTIKYSTSPKENGPEGGGRSWTDLLRTYPLNESPKGALIGRIGERDTARPFLIGQKREQRVGLDGRLFVGINQVSLDRAEGSFAVKAEVFRAKPGQGAISKAITTRLTQAQLDSIPKRVVDKDNNPGDRVNFIVVGSENQVKNALANAGWVTVDRSTKDAVFRGILASVSKQAYVTVPMSELMMFGRGQDYGYAQGDPIRVIAARHHFRIWKAAFTVGGQTVWVGAGTHDVGFDKDQRNGKLTHKIDPDTDKERDYIARSLTESGQVIGNEYMTMTDPVKEAKTAHGQPFRSDGRTAIIYFPPDTADTSDHFADYFCSVLAQNNPDGGNWGGCDQYLEDNGKKDFKLPGFSNKYRILIVPGFMSSCFPESPAFEEGQTALKSKYGMDVALLSVPNDASEDNAKMIGDYLREN